MCASGSSAASAAAKLAALEPSTAVEILTALPRGAAAAALQPMLDAPRAAVLAAAAGKVVYSGQGLRGYGKLVIIKHNKTFLSAYAHNSNILVKEGQSVTRGQRIAEIGNTDSDSPKLHFEIRRFGKPTDPIKFLPAR